MGYKSLNYIIRLRKTIERVFYFFIFLAGLFLFFYFFINVNYQSKDGENNLQKNEQIVFNNEKNKLPGKFVEDKLKFPNPSPSPPKTINVPILMYHSIGSLSPSPTSLERDLTVSPANFEQQLIYLKEKKYQTILMEDLFQTIYYNKKLPPKPIILTFDDGYDNHYYNVYPLLKKYKFKGSFYIITSLVNQPGRINQQQIKELADNGMEIGSHSVSHPDFSHLNEQEINNELHYSKLLLEKIINKKIYFFCYPSGKYNNHSFPILKKEGYLLALTTNSGTLISSDHPFEVPRLRITGDESLENFKKLLP